MTAVTSSPPIAGKLPTEPGSWADFPAFIEVQFPVSKVSKESYKERKANNGQTLTALGKWWGRKPLVLLRAAILGLLLPTTNDPETDRSVFLALMTMDDVGLLRRLRSSLPIKDIYEHATASERGQFFEAQGGRYRWRQGIAVEDRQRLQRVTFLRMGYDERLKHCLRPEEIDGPDEATWKTINLHLGTAASNLPEFVQQLGERRFCHYPRIGDGFAGGGSTPFEAARLGCDACASDLNPVAALLSWSALKVLGAGPDQIKQIKTTQTDVFDSVAAQIQQWGIETNQDGWQADAFLYCSEVLDSVSGWRVPVSHSWVIGQGSKTILRLVPRPAERSFDFEVVVDASSADIEQASLEGTWRNGLACPVDAEGRWITPSTRIITSMEQLLGREGLRRWEKSDIEPRDSDVFQERLCCIRWVDPISGRRVFRAPTKEDLEREARVRSLLQERLQVWQEAGYVPSNKVEPGHDNGRPIRARGWTYWHHFFNPRQLLVGGEYARQATEAAKTVEEKATLLLAVGRYANWNSRLTGWISDGANEKSRETFYTPALNTPPVIYCCRGFSAMRTALLMDLDSHDLPGRSVIALDDARAITFRSDLWITDPGYSDSVNYAELSEFFLAWYGEQLPALFPDWYSDSKRALAVEGAGQDFRQAMRECYSNFTNLMPENGIQIVMFTHQNADVWADLALIMWAAGLQVVSAWTVATETEAAGIRQGNYVQGTVLLVLRKRRDERRGDMSDLYPDLQAEVQAQLQSMLALDDKEDPNFSDADYQLAAYAAALRVLTSYSAIDEVDIPRELARPRVRGERSPLVGLIERAVRIASDVLVPTGLERSVWRNLSPEERFYVKGVEVESHGDYREGVYQEYARGYGVREYRPLLASGTANQVRLKTPTEFRARDLAGDGFNGSLLRKVLFAIYKSAEEKDPRVGREYLRTELSDYWDRRQLIIALVTYLANRPKPETSMPHWKGDVEAAQLLRGSIENDSI
jgi:putative DNA methylase